MQLHQLQRRTKLKKTRRIGRGGKRGTTSGRGTKGQKARAGHKLRPELRDIIKKLPKKRGYKFKSIQDKVAVFNLDKLEQVFSAGETVSGATLSEKKLLSRKDAKAGSIKILGRGQITKKLNFVGCKVSASAKEAITKAGGSVS